MKLFPTFSRVPRVELLTLAVSVGIAAGIVIFFSFYADAVRVVQLVKVGGLGPLVIVIAVTLHSIYRMLKWRLDETPAFVQFTRWCWAHRGITVVWLLCSVLAMAIFPQGNRILMDEIIVLATSKAIHAEKEPVTPSTIESHAGIQKLSAAYIDKRPYLFATVVAAFHDLLGYSPANAFRANMLLGALTLALVGALGTKFGGSTYAGGVAMLALTTVPLFCEHVTGGGIDVINLCSIASVLLLGILHLEHPSVWSARALLGASVLLAYARYESMLFLALPLVVLVVVLHREHRFYLDGVTLLLWPAIVPLCGIHFLTFSKLADSFQLAEQGTSEAFSLAYIPQNITHGLVFFLNTEHLLTNSSVVFVIGFVAVLLLVVSALRRLRKLEITASDVGYWSFAAITLGGFTLLMAYSWGALDQPVASRLSLPLYLLFALSIAAAAKQISNHRGYGLVVGFLCMGSIYWVSFPLAAKRYGLQMYPTAQVLALMDEFNSQQPDRHFAVLNTITNFWLTRDVFDVAPAALDGNPKFLLNMLESGSFRRVYLIQSLKRDDASGIFQMNKRDVLTLPVETELISEDYVADSIKLRISLLKPSSTVRLRELAEKADLAAKAQPGTTAEFATSAEKNRGAGAATPSVVDIASSLEAEY
jgi:hypothetical protein